MQIDICKKTTNKIWSRMNNRYLPTVFILCVLYATRKEIEWFLNQPWANLFLQIHKIYLGKNVDHVIEITRRLKVKTVTISLAMVVTNASFRNTVLH